jgi:FHS family Na+ dependent glucose MFS transporter 1
LGYVIGALLGGRLFDQRAAHPIMAAAMITTAAIFVMVPMASILWLLLGLMFLMGVAESVVDVGGNTLLIWVHGRKVGPFMNGLHLFFGIGGFLAPLLVAWILGRQGGLEAVYWSMAIFILPMAAWMAFLPSPEIQHKTGVHTSQSGTSLLVGGMMLFFFLYGGAECAFGGWIYTYALKMNMADETGAAYLTSAFWGAFTLGRLVAVPLATQFKPGSLLLTNLCGGLLSLAAILALPHSSTALFLGTIGIGAFMAAIFPSALSFSDARLKITGRITGWFFVGGSTGAMVLPFVIGQFIDDWGGRAVIVPIAAALFGALVLLGVIFMLPHGRRKA